MKCNVYILVMCAILVPSTKATAQDDDHLTLKRLWNFPRTDFERRVSEMASVEPFIETIDICCVYVEVGEKKYPITKLQRDELTKVGDAAAIRFIRDAQVDMLLEIYCLRAYDNDPLPPGAFKYESLAEFRIGMKATLAVMRRSYRMTDAIFSRWKQIATPDQWAKIMKYNPNHWRFFNNKARAESFEYAQRQADGKLTEKEFREAKINPNGPRELTLSAIPSLSVSSSSVGLETWHFRVAAFVRRYNLTPAQQQAASVILEDSLKKAGEYRQWHDAQLQRLWKQLLNAYLFPEESQVTVKQAMRQFRRTAQAAVRPIYEKMQQRLMGLLTTEQKHNVGPPPPKPKWMELMEIALQDDDASPLAPIGPVPSTQPGLSPGR